MPLKTHGQPLFHPFSTYIYKHPWLPWAMNQQLNMATYLYTPSVSKLDTENN